MSHTPEPWEVVVDVAGRIMRNNDEYVIADCCLDYSSLEVDEQEANARRIVACVNACQGVDNETLEKIASGDMDGSEIFELSKVKQQRDELAEALGIITDQLERVGDTRYHKDGQFIEEARAALAKVRGEDEAPELFPGTLEQLRGLGRKG